MATVEDTSATAVSADVYTEAQWEELLDAIRSLVAKAYQSGGKNRIGYLKSAVQSALAAYVSNPTDWAIYDEKALDLVMLIVETARADIASHTSSITALLAATATAINGAGLLFSFDSSTSDADPGDGGFRLNNATLGSVTEIYISDDDIYGNDLSAFIQGWDSSGDTTNRGTLILHGVDTNTAFLIATVSGSVTDATSYSKATLSVIASGGTFTAGENFLVSFGASGANGDTTGPASATDSAVALFDGTTGNLIKDSAVLLSALATLAGPETLTNKTLTEPVLNGPLSGTGILDEDAMSSDSATAVPTQQSVKAYVDAKVLLPSIILENQQSNGTNDTTALTADTWITAVLNTEVRDADGDTSLSSNTFSLPAGTYYIEADIPITTDFGGKARIYNVTDTAVELLGTTFYGNSGIRTIITQVRGVFTIAVTKTFRIEAYSLNGEVSMARAEGSATAGAERYSQVRIWK